MGSEGLPFLRDSMEDYANNGSAMPESHEEQVKRGMRIVENAFNGKVEAQLQELQGLKKLTEELQLQSNVLNEKNSTLQAELHQSQQVGNQLADENKELFKQVQQLRKKMARLDILKNKVLESITHAGDDDDALEDAGSYAGGHGGYGGAARYVTLPPASGAASRGISPTPTSHGALAPARAESPMPSPEVGGAVDGKQFFRQARRVLSNEAFDSFLTSIKRLNSQLQTREETLAEASRLFGAQHQDLAQEFERLLQKHTF